jgi:hypothetical protein
MQAVHIRRRESQTGSCARRGTADKIQIRAASRCQPHERLHAVTVLEMTKPADLKSAGHAAVPSAVQMVTGVGQKHPKTLWYDFLSHNNIRKTGSIRNRQVTS